MSAEVRARNAAYKKLKDSESVVHNYTVVQINTGNDEIELCKAAEARPYAATIRNTKSKRQQLIGIDAFDTGADFPGKMKVTRTGMVEFPVDVNNAEIVIGDMLIVGDDVHAPVLPAPTGGIGRVDKGNPATPAEFSRRVGWAEEAIPAGTGTLPGAVTVKAWLDFERGGM